MPCPAIVYVDDCLNQFRDSMSELRFDELEEAEELRNQILDLIN